MTKTTTIKPKTTTKAKQITKPKKAQEPQVTCLTPTPHKEPTRMDKWKYDLVRHAILEVVPRDDIGMMFRQLPSVVRNFLSKEDRQRLGGVTWYVTTVKLDLEVRGEIQRIPGMRPQYLHRPT